MREERYGNLNRLFGEGKRREEEMTALQEGGIHS